MLSWILQITIISIILISLIHHLILFFKSTLTVPKIKDIVGTTTQKYENMFNVINNSNTNHNSSLQKDYTLIDLLPTADTINEMDINNTFKPNNMKAELKYFLKSQLHQ